MLKLYANIFRLKESTLTRASIRRLWVLVMLSLPFLPLLLLLRLNIARDFPSLDGFHAALNGGFGYSIFVVSFLAWAALLLTRVVNRFWVRDRYLDEWEVETKRASMTFAFQFMAYLFAVSFLAVLVAQSFNLDGGIDVSLLTATVTALFLSMYAQIFFVLSKLRTMDEAQGEDPKDGIVAPT